MSVRDFRSAFVDPLALQQFRAIHIANTKFLDYLPKFCRDFLGVPVEEVSLWASFFQRGAVHLFPGLLVEEWCPGRGRDMMVSARHRADLATIARCWVLLTQPPGQAYLYSVDRAGCSVFALRDGTDDKWREYRFPFQVALDFDPFSASARARCGR